MTTENNTANVPDVDHAEFFYDENPFFAEAERGFRFAPIKHLDNKKLESKVLNQFDIDRNISNELESMMRDVDGKLIEYAFQPYIVELSRIALDITDQAIGIDHFVALIQANPQVAVHYASEMARNLLGDTAERGAIVPSLALYKCNFWVSHIPLIQEQIEPRSRTETDRTIRVQHYSRPNSASLTDDIERMQSYISNFHAQLLHNLPDSDRPWCTDIIVIPLQHIVQRQEEPINTTRPGGALIAVGRFMEYVSSQEHRQKVENRLASLAKLFDVMTRAELTRVFMDWEREQSEATASSLRRGAIHESRAFARLMESANTKQQEYMEAGQYDQALKATREVQNSITVFRNIVNALIEGNLDDDQTFIDLKDALDVTKAYAWHSWQIDDLYRNDMLERGHDLEAIARFISDFPAIYKDREAMNEKYEGPFGRCVVALRNLLDNAIKGDGDLYDERGKLLNRGVPRPFDLTAYYVPENGKSSHPQIVIANSAMLAAETYDHSWEWLSSVDPVGFYLPIATSRYGGRTTTTSNRALTVRGGRLAQILLNLLGYRIRFDRRLNESGLHDGTKMIVELRGNKGG